MRNENSLNRSSVESLKRDEPHALASPQSINGPTPPGSGFRVPSSGLIVDREKLGTRNPELHPFQRFNDLTFQRFNR